MSVLADGSLCFLYLSMKDGLHRERYDKGQLRGINT